MDSLNKSGNVEYKIRNVVISSVPFTPCKTVSIAVNCAALRWTEMQVNAFEADNKQQYKTSLLL